MLPILVSLGPVKIYSYGVCLAIGLFIALYFWWKMGRDEHFDEIALFDGFFLSLMIFALVGRMGYVLWHYDQFGSITKYFAWLSYPGISGVVGILAAGIFVILFARYRGWDEWKVADNAVVTLSMVLIMASLGGLLNGSNPGIEASWGLRYPGDEVARVPLDLLMMVWSVVTFGIVSRVRKNFRFYAWYKGEASTAQEGLASLIFLGLVGFYYSIATWVTQDPWRLGAVPGGFLVGIMTVVVIGYLIYKRVGRRDTSLWGKLKAIIRRK